MADRLVLHLGSMKSGTSHIQNVLGRNKELLADRGLLFPGERWVRQVAAVRELIDTGGPGQPAMPADGAWQRLVEEIHAWDGTAVVSMEFLAPRSEAKIEQIRSFFPDTPVQAILTARDLARNVPAMWLESMQTGGTTAWADFVESVRRRKGDKPSRYFWKHQNTPDIMARWAGRLGAENVSMVTVPRAGAPRDTLWDRFGEALSVDVSGCDLDVRSNPAIGLTSALVLLRLNQSFEREHGRMPPFYDTYVKHRLAKRRLVHHAGDEPRLGFEAGWVQKASAQQIRRLAADGHRIVGDLADLRSEPVPGVDPASVALEDILDTAVVALGASLDGWSSSARRKQAAQGAAG